MLSAARLARNRRPRCTQLAGRAWFATARLPRRVTQPRVGTLNTPPPPPTGKEEDGRPPVPLFWRLLAVGSTFVAFFAVFGHNEENLTGKTTPTLNPSTFTRSVIHSVLPSEPYGQQETNKDHVVVQMRIPVRLLPEDNSHLANAIHHIYIKDDDMQIERPYTPINGIGLDGSVVLWVKRYVGGEVSNWISRLERNRGIEIRGPVKQWDWRSGEWDEIIMISGGTGITAFAQLLHQAFFSSQPVTSPHGASTHFTLLHGHRSPSQLPPKVITEDFDRYLEYDSSRLQIRGFVDQLENTEDDPPRNIAIGRVDKDVILRVLRDRKIVLEEPIQSGSSFLQRATGAKKQTRISINPAKSVMIILCGPEGMINGLAGPRPREGQPDRVGGVLGELGFTVDQIRRL